MARGSIELRALAPANLPGYFLLCLRVGLLSFGGGLSGWMYREVVDRRRWMAPREFLSALGLAQILPGANIANLTVAIGQRLFGLRGAVAGLVGLLVGPFFVVIAVAGIYAALARLAWVGHFLDGVAAAAIGLLLLTALKAGEQVAKSIVPIVVMAATFIAIGLLGLPLLPVVLCVAPVSVALAWRNPPPDPSGDD